MSGRAAVGVGVIGAGVISRQYLENLTAFPDIEVRAVGDLDPRRAADRAREFGVPAAGDVATVLGDPGVELVVNLTIPAAHVEVGMAALEAGKHVWSEKPLALDRAGARLLLDRAAQLGLRATSAPDTFLGPAAQALRRCVDEGGIGRPTFATAAFESPGPERWHPDPSFLYDHGAGPLFDMGPYYVTALVQLLGSVTRVGAVGATSTATRRVGSGPRAGTEFPVRVPTTVAAVLDFDSGAVAQATFSFDAVVPRIGVLEIRGTEGHVVGADPNMFEGPVTLTRAGAEAATSLEGGGAGHGRGLGVLELARSLREGRPERASGELAAHVLDVLIAIDDAVRTRATVEVASRAPRAEPLEPDWDPTESTLGTG